MPHRSILIIEDDPKIQQVVSKGLKEEGFKVISVSTGEEGLTALDANAISLVILDVMLPGKNGLQVCQEIRQKSSIPILMLTALASAENVALGLDMGADDYLSKPFKFIELIARIRSLLRRSEQTAGPALELLKFGDITLNDTEKVVVRGGKVLTLTSTEFKLLQLFLTHPKRVLDRMEILEKVWGYNFDLGTNVVDVYINYLRKKLETDGLPRVIHTVIGMGYVLREEA